MKGGNCHTNEFFSPKTPENAGFSHYLTQDTNKNMVLCIA
jgi:hypothetical protein